MAGEFDDRLAQVWEDEGLFSRDILGQLIRLEPATQEDYTRDVTISIDGRQVTVKKATPLTDSQGNIVNDAAGRTVPRDTTIYDAAQQLSREQSVPNPIPTLCHAEHMSPVGVCRICSVEVFRERDGELEPGKKLIPACHHPVQPGMIVHTVNSPDKQLSERVRNSVRVLTELLTSDHLPDAPANANGGADLNELARLAANPELNCSPGRFASSATAPNKAAESKHPLIAVDHSACILCERCMRGCNDIKQNHVIGRTGKGYETEISFDLDQLIEDSSCVSCGECMVSCPTDALTFRNPIDSDWFKQAVKQPNCHAVSPEELQRHFLFKGIPYKWLQWNAASIVRREVKKGDVLCWLGEYDSTAFLLNEGEFGLWFEKPEEKPRGVLDWLLDSVRGVRGRALVSAKKPDPEKPTTEPTAVLNSEDVIVGEMTCMSFYPRSATIMALTDGEVYEVRRNVLYMLQRNVSSREQLDNVYRERALQRQVHQTNFFADLTEAERNRVTEILRDRVELVRVDPGQTIFRQGERADAMFIIRLGFVKVTQTYEGIDRVIRYVGPGRHFGEFGLLTREELESLGLPDIPPDFTNRRTATCEALDDVELVRIDRGDLDELIREFAPLRDRLARPDYAQKPDKEPPLPGGPLDEFLDQGLFNAQRLLVLDLESCTRCDECVKACADTHGGTTRLVREGLRFDKYLVASACRSCLDPYCMVGCPVDAIHREGSLEIEIDSHCIGCGLCARNCPYGNINMVPDQTQQRATTCDLCRSVGVDATNPLDEVSCVYACPHNAAFRMSGEQLLHGVTAKDAN